MLIQSITLAVLLSADPRPRLQATLDSLARSVDGRVGIAVTLVEASRPLSAGGPGRFPMQSVYKLPIAMAVLDAVDHHQLTLDDSVAVTAADIAPVHSPIRERFPRGNVTFPLHELLRLASVESDGTASDVLLRLVPAPTVQAYLHRIGVDSVRIETTEQAMAADELAQYRNWATPAGAVALLASLQGGKALAPASTTQLLEWLTAAMTGPNRLRAGLPAGTRLAHKTGTDRTRNGLTRATNDIGLVTLPDGRHLAIAVFVMDSRAEEADRERLMARVARAAWEAWTSRALDG